jgi:lysophospholipase L1-like esterase
MWFRVFLVSWAFALLALLGWLASHTSADSMIFGRYSSAYFTLLAFVAVLVGFSVLVHAPFLYQRFYRFRRELILMSSTILASVLIAEIAIRTLDPLGISYFEESSRYQLEKIPDPVLVYRHAPGLRRTYQGVEVSINELGLRDRKLEQRRTEELRVLMLGDSVTFGWGVAIEATFARRLESILAARQQRPVRTVNAGVGGYNTVQEYAFLRNFVDVIEPDIVILLYIRNDIQSNDPPFDPWTELDLNKNTPPDVIRILLGKSWLYTLGLFAVRYSRPARRTTLDKNARGVKESMDALSDIAALCRNRGIDFVTFFYRSRRESPAIPSVTDELFATIRDIGHEKGFPVIDVGIWWGNIDMRSLSNSVVDRHPNQQGHEILAIGMADFLVKNGFVSKAVFELGTKRK